MLMNRRPTAEIPLAEDPLRHLCKSCSAAPKSFAASRFFFLRARRASWSSALLCPNRSRQDQNEEIALIYYFYVIPRINIFIPNRRARMLVIFELVNRIRSQLSRHV